MNCARLFDAKSDISIGNLIEEVSSHSTEIDALAISIFSDRPNFDRLNPIVHPLAEDEERFTPKRLSLNAQMKNCSEIITEWLPCV